MNPQHLLQNAGFIWVENEVRLHNYALPYLQKIQGTMSIREPLPTDLLRPWEAGQNTVAPRVTLLHFSLHECEHCPSEVKYLHSFFSGSRLPGMLLAHKAPQHIGLVQMEYGTNATQFVADDMTPLLPEGAKTHLDLDDGIAERLGVIGAPATWLVDEQGFVIGYRNGPMNFESPGFEALVGWLEKRGADASKLGINQSLHAALTGTAEENATPRVKVLNETFVHIFAVGIAALVCYAAFRIVVYRKDRTRKQ